MGTSSDRIRTDIESTRQQLAGDLDRLADRVSPMGSVRRNGGALKESATGARDRVREAATHSTERARQRGQGGAQSLRDGAGQAAEQARGNPLAAGAVGFAVGVLAAAVLPGSDREQRAAGRIAERAAPQLDPLRDAATRSAREFGSEARESMRQAADEIRLSATEAARQTRERAGHPG
ncbi:DUF3618 domain-containing protein [Streptomyces sp. 3MP-14]|uniref:DUF3618 domain-containing protein n=1 Tax=Streptomyces mimosae TaxID=2586635 RepID=A0A5N6ASK1_9ACTN|nr:MULTISPECIES: DUF3618 domain-containing protein [Streptomyces]KAB8171145.1 DUF3618 domain-containing protein [Streptomyces mimosae]KAB8179503.1 DUF3618 domain-containing protein [Streptomyces sp. 3MP-14]